MLTFEEIRLQGEVAESGNLAEAIQRYLEERNIFLGKGARYGQAVILAGGAGSGKGFAVNNVLQGSLYKVLDVDDLKVMILKMRDKMVETGQLPGSAKLADAVKKARNYNLLNPKDTTKMHLLVKSLDIADKRMYHLLFDPTKTVLPNVMFDMTLKSPDDLYGSAKEKGMIETLTSAGYKPENIHIVWVLTNYRVAMQQNLTRDRIVQADILLSTHSGASYTVQNYVLKNYRNMGINGDVVVILGGAAFYTKGSVVVNKRTGEKHIVKSDTKVLRPDSLKAFVVKKAGTMAIDQAAVDEIEKHIIQLAPPPDVDPQKELDIAVDVVRKKGKLRPDVAKFLGYET